MLSKILRPDRWQVTMNEGGSHNHDGNRKTLERIQQRRFELLKLELSNLALKIDMSVKNLWIIRSFSITIWSGVIAIGIGQFANGNISPSLLIIAVFMPAIFFFIDAKYQRWYRRIVLRERKIIDFINRRSCANSEFEDTSFESDFENRTCRFPIYDLSATHTLVNDKEYEWQTSLWRQFLDSTPLSIYGSQMIASGLIAWVKISPTRFSDVNVDGSYAFFASVAIIVIIICIALLQKARLNRNS